MSLEVERNIEGGTHPAICGARNASQNGCLPGIRSTDNQCTKSANFPSYFRIHCRTLPKPEHMKQHQTLTGRAPTIDVSGMTIKNKENTPDRWAGPTPRVFKTPNRLPDVMPFRLILSGFGYRSSPQTMVNLRDSKCCRKSGRIYS